MISTKETIIVRYDPGVNRRPLLKAAGLLTAGAGVFGAIPTILEIDKAKINETVEKRLPAKHSMRLIDEATCISDELLTSGDKFGGAHSDGIQKRLKAADKVLEYEWKRNSEKVRLLRESAIQHSPFLLLTFPFAAAAGIILFRDGIARFLKTISQKKKAEHQMP